MRSRRRILRSPMLNETPDPVRSQIAGMKEMVFQQKL